jgi:hypothetical protein
MVVAGLFAFARPRATGFPYGIARSREERRPDVVTPRRGHVAHIRGRVSNINDEERQLNMQRYDPYKAPDPKEWSDMDEQERINLIEQYHRRAGIRLPNVTVHAVIHAVIETQIALGDELPVRRTLERLMSEGLDRHDALHAIGSVLAGHMHDLLSRPKTTSKADPNEPYYAALERLTAEEWLRSG